MKEIVKKLFGINLICFKHLVTGHPFRFLNSAQNAFEAVEKQKFIQPIDLIPAQDIGTILGTKQVEVKVILMKYEDGSLQSYESLVVAAIAKAEKVKTILEIGTFMGSTTLLFAKNCPQADIHTVDLPLTYETELNQKSIKDDFHLIKKRDVGRDFRNYEKKVKIKQHFQDTVDWDFRGIGEPDLFFIDGSHTYEHCKNDSEKCFALNKGKGVFIWHDVNQEHPGVVKLINEWRDQGRDITRIQGTSLGYWKNS